MQVTLLGVLEGPGERDEFGEFWPEKRRVWLLEGKGVIVKFGRGLEGFGFFWRGLKCGVLRN